MANPSVVQVTQKSKSKKYPWVDPTGVDPNEWRCHSFIRCHLRIPILALLSVVNVMKTK